jgi:hypothetical protein
VSGGVLSVLSDVQSAVSADLRFTLSDDTRSVVFKSLKDRHIS